METELCLTTERRTSKVRSNATEIFDCGAGTVQRNSVVADCFTWCVSNIRLTAFTVTQQWYVIVIHLSSPLVDEVSDFVCEVIFLIDSMY